MKAEEVYAKLKNLIELNEGISKKTEIDDTNVSNKTTYSSEKIVKEIEALKSIQSLEYEGTDVTCENTLTSRTSDVIVKGQTYQNLIDYNDATMKGDSTTTVVKSQNSIKATITKGGSSIAYFPCEMLKDNTVYTLLFNLITNYNSYTLTASFKQKGGSFAEGSINIKSGYCKIKITTTTANEGICIGNLGTERIGNNIEIQNLIVLEGDWTNKEVPENITGIESAGEKENKISILSKNLKTTDFIALAKKNSDLNVVNDTIICPSNKNWVKIPCENIDTSKPVNIKYDIKLDDNFIVGEDTNSLIRLIYKSTGDTINKAGISKGTKLSDKFKTITIKNIVLDERAQAGIYFVFRNMEGKTIYIRNLIVTNDNIDENTTYKDDKKEILLPIQGGLKSLPNGTADTIEQRNDGVYLVQRVKKEAYADGDENNNNYLTDKVNTYKPLETPIETKLDIQNLDLEVYKNITYITTDNVIQPVLSFKIPSNIGGIIQENAQNINKLYKINDEIIIPQLINNSADNINYQNSNYPLWTNVKKTLDGIIAKIDYIKPEITSFTSTAQAVYEVGQKISNIVFNWTTNKNVTTQTLTDCTINADSRTATYTNEISSNKTFTLTIGDGQNTASKSISIAFRNKIYYGSASIPSNFNSAFILGLSKKQFATSKSGSFSITVGSNEYGFIAFPSSFGTLTSVKIGGFDTDVTSCGNISFTNSSNGVATYSIYRTGRHSLGAITMVIN